MPSYFNAINLWLFWHHLFPVVTGTQNVPKILWQITVRNVRLILNSVELNSIDSPSFFFKHILSYMPIVFTGIILLRHVSLYIII